VDELDGESKREPYDLSIELAILDTKNLVAKTHPTSDGSLLRSWIPCLLFQSQGVVPYVWRVLANSRYRFNSSRTDHIEQSL